MINKIWLYESECLDPYLNLAIEQHLMETVEEDACILFLWQNQNTVVIGKNQNAWQECRTALLCEDGVYLARRLSGGGAVYHDLGNLNFTFLLSQSEYDLDRQFSVITQAINMLGVHAERSGRNDVLAHGRKFSGNAFYKNGKRAYHHGTLLVNADMDKLSRYLNPSKAKLESKGVVSVRSRVANLAEFNPQITVSSVKEAMVAAFEKVYALPCCRLDAHMLNRHAVDSLYQRNASWEWNYGQKLPFTVEFGERFPWGSIQICLQVEHGMICGAKVYSDAMDWSVAPELEELLIGCRFIKSDILSRVSHLKSPCASDICDLFQKQEM